MTRSSMLAIPERAETAPSKPYRVLFVCTGNTCRSPMAAALFYDMMVRERGEDNFAVSSAGLYAAEGAPISPHAAEALAGAGVKETAQNHYRAHRARMVREELIDEADEVVAISGSHAMELLMRYPMHTAKITALPFDIPDPFGGDIAVYRDCLDALAHAIRLKWSLGEGEA